MANETIIKTMLSNGMRINLKQQPHLRTISLGLFIKHGAQYEDLSTSGAAHFIEHVVFNHRYLSKQAKEVIEFLLNAGSSYEATTSKEFTRFTLTCLPHQLPKAVEALSLIVKSQEVNEAALEHERSIILDEHSMAFSSGVVAKELLDNALWGDQSLGLFVLGRKENIRRFDIQELQIQLSNNYTPSRAFFAALGPIELTEFVTFVEEYFGGWDSYSERQSQLYTINEPKMVAIPSLRNRVDLILGYLGVPFTSNDRNDMELLADVLGGGITSRLFVELREKQQLVYLVQASPISYELGGYIAIHVNCERKQIKVVYQAIQDELEKIKNDGVTQEELDSARARRTTSVLSSLGDNNEHLRLMGRKALLDQDYFVDLEAQGLAATKVTSIEALAKRIFISENVAAVGIGLTSEALLELI